MAVEKRVGFEVSVGSVFILILMLLYIGRLGTAAPLLSVDFPVWSAITFVYRNLSQAISFLILSAMSLDTSFSSELMPLDFLVDLIPFLLILLGLALSGLPEDDAPNHVASDRASPVARILAKILLAVLGIGFFAWGASIAFLDPWRSIDSPEALKDVFPFWSGATHYALTLSPFELLRKFSIYAAILIVGLIGVRGALTFQEKSFLVFLIIFFSFNLLVIWGGIFAFPLVPAFFIQLGDFAEPALPWFQRFVAALAAWFQAAGW